MKAIILFLLFFYGHVHSKAWKLTEAGSVTCKVPSKPNYFVHDEELHAGEHLEFSCKNNELLVGAPRVFCKQDGTWSAPFPTCQISGKSKAASPCREPGTPQFATRITTQKPKGVFYPDGSIITFNCKSGYELIGPSKITCQDNGQWDDGLPTCRKTSIPCRELGTPQFATRTPSQKQKSAFYPDGSIITFICIPGYELIGPSKITCRDNGQWDHELPTCRPSFCEEPDTPENGYKIVYSSDDNIHPGTEARFGCKKGYHINGKADVLCTENGIWSDEPPTCEENNYCLKPEGEFRIIQIVKYYFQEGIINELPKGTVLQINCQEGTQLVGHSQITCMGKNEWSPKIPQCVIVQEMHIECETVGTQIDFSLNKELKLHCPPNCTRRSGQLIWGYKFYNQSSHICLAAIHAGVLTTDGGPLTIATNGTCQKFESKTSNGIHSISLNKESPCFTFYNHCNKPEIKFGYLEFLNHGAKKITNNEYPKGTKIKVKCQRGTKLVGYGEIVCEGNNDWWPAITRCVIVDDIDITCDTVGTQIDFATSTTLNLFCPQGCTDKAEQHTSIWGYKFYTMDSNICLAAIHAGIVSEDGGPITVTSNGTCDNFESEFSHNINSTRMDIETPCFNFYTPCPTPQTIANGYFLVHHLQTDYVTMSANYSINSLVIYKCNSNKAELIGTRVRTCLADGTWSGKLPYCKNKSTEECNDPGTVEFSTREMALNFKGNFPIGTRLTYQCQTNTTLVGPSEITCLKNGVWSAKAPICKISSDWEISCDTKANQIDLPFGKYLQMICPYNCKGNEIENPIWGTEYYKMDSYVCRAAMHAGVLLKKNRIILIVNDGIKNEFPGQRQNGISSNWYKGFDLSFTFIELNSCSPPPQIKNAKYELINNETYLQYEERYATDAKVMYSCNLFYHHKTPNRMKTCLQNGTWSTEEISCKLNCAIPKVPFSDELENRWPWHVGVWIKITIKNEIRHTMVCGGSLLNENWLVTSAQCVTEHDKVIQNPDMSFYTIGEYDTTNKSEIQLRKAKNIILHPQYHPASLNFDLALVELNDTVKLGRCAQPICLPDDIPLDGPLQSVGTMMGWIWMEEQKTLKLTTVNMLEKDMCKRYFAISPQFPKTTMFCAEIGTAHVLGQSGEGLVFANTSSLPITYTLLGILSHWSINYQHVNSFTNVTAVLPWIRSIIDD